MIGPCKFDELSLKTDRQLIQLMYRQIDIGICAAQQALKSADDLVCADACRQTARRAYAEAARLMAFLGKTFLGKIGCEERSGVESKLERLRQMFEPLSAIGSTPAPTEDKIA